MKKTTVWNSKSKKDVQTTTTILKRDVVDEKQRWILEREVKMIERVVGTRHVKKNNELMFWFSFKREKQNQNTNPKKQYLKNAGTRCLLWSSQNQPSPPPKHTHTPERVRRGGPKHKIRILAWKTV